MVVLLINIAAIFTSLRQVPKHENLAATGNGNNDADDNGAYYICVRCDGEVMIMLALIK
jgi:hypothetical protein